MLRTFPCGTYGAVSESLCSAYYSHLGYTVSKPISGDSRYDLIVDDGSSLKRVQCKTSITKNKYPETNLRATGKKKHYLVTDFDILWVLTLQGIYVLNVEDIPTKDGKISNFALSPKYNAFLIDFPISLSPHPIKYQKVDIVPEQELTRITSLARLGVPLRTIASIMGLTQTQVQHITKTNGVPLRQNVTPEIREDIIKMYEKCVSAPVIAEILGYKHGVINRVIKEHYEKLPGHRRPKLSESDRRKVSEMRSAGASLSEMVEAIENIPERYSRPTDPTV